MQDARGVKRAERADRIMCVRALVHPPQGQPGKSLLQMFGGPCPAIKIEGPRYAPLRIREPASSGLTTVNPSSAAPEK
jgi:hypothetical protein